jgi:hypothetical protein
MAEMEGKLRKTGEIYIPLTDLSPLKIEDSDVKKKQGPRLKTTPSSH